MLRAFVRPLVEAPLPLIVFGFEDAEREELQRMAAAHAAVREAEMLPSGTAAPQPCGLVEAARKRSKELQAERETGSFGNEWQVTADSAGLRGFLRILADTARKDQTEKKAREMRTGELRK